MSLFVSNINELINNTVDSALLTSHTDMLSEQYLNTI